jgi:hypothetical protein
LSAETNVDIVNRVPVTADGKPSLSPGGEPQTLDGAGALVTGFRPIAADWLSPNLKSPNRLRILFFKQVL